MIQALQTEEDTTSDCSFENQNNMLKGDLYWLLTLLPVLELPVRCIIKRVDNRLQMVPSGIHVVKGTI